MAHEPADMVSVAEAFANVARLLAAHDDDEQTTLDKIVHLAVEHLDACEFAGITKVVRGRVFSPASSNDIPRILDEIQAETGEGPCIDAIRDHEVFETGDLASEARWPHFSARAHEVTGVSSILSVRLFVEEDTMGALNLYSRVPHAFDDSDVALASVFAAHAAVAMQGAIREAGLEDKARSRDVIGQAKGILMARSGIDEDRAFAMLRAASQRMNVKLRDLAQDLADGKPLGEPPP